MPQHDSLLRAACIESDAVLTPEARSEEALQLLPGLLEQHPAGYGSQIQFTRFNSENLFKSSVTWQIEERRHIAYIIPGKIPPTDGGPSAGRFPMVPSPRVPGTATTTAHRWELKPGSQIPDSGGSVVLNQQAGRSAQDLIWETPTLPGYGDQPGLLPP